MDLRAEDRSQTSEVRSQKSEVCYLISVIRPLSSILRHPSSVLCLLFSVFCFLSLATAQAATEFECTIKADGTGDYSTLASWESANPCDLTTSVVLSHGGITGTIADGSYVKGAVSGAYGTVTHCTSTQIAIKDVIIGTFQDAEQINKTVALGGDISSPAANVTASSAPDSVIAVAKIDGSWSTAESSALTIDTWTTSANNYIRIYTTSAARHSGRWDDTNSYRIEAAAVGPNTHLVDIKENYVRIEGLQVHLTNSGDYAGCNAINIDSQVDASEIIINNNILKGTISGTSSEAIGIYGNDAEITAKIYNNIIYDFINGGTTNKAGIKTAIAGGTYYLYNNTVHGNYEGINVGAGTTVIAKNTVLKSCTTPATGTFAAGTDYNATDSISIGYTVTGAGNIHDKLSQAFAFLSETTDDFHLAAADTSARDAGVSLLSEFADDIDSDSRPQGSAWDIGADEGGDNTAPILETVTASSLYTADDTIRLTFDEPMDTSTIAEGCSTLLIRYYDNCSDGTCTGGITIPTRYATVAWSAENTIAVITLDERPD